MKIKIRHENPGDYVEIKKVHDLAFNQPNEGLLVEKLRSNPEFIAELSLIVEVEGNIIGHILFFPIWIYDENSRHQSLALAPMSVLPKYQKIGIGSRLVVRGLKIARELGYTSVIVVGHPTYYPKFGFVPASQYGIKAPFDIADEAFMVLELIPTGLTGISGVVQYPGEFEEVD